jgi:hypothetical protein
MRMPFDVEHCCLFQAGPATFDRPLLLRADAWFLFPQERWPESDSASSIP